jgi:hypothetical protein
VKRAGKVIRGEEATRGGKVARGGKATKVRLARRGGKATRVGKVARGGEATRGKKANKRCLLIGNGEQDAEMQEDRRWWQDKRQRQQWTRDRV